MTNPATTTRAQSAQPEGVNAADLEERRRLVELAVVFSSAFQKWMATTTADGLSYPRMRLLEQLHCQGPEMMRALADDLSLSPRNMTALVDSLEAEGLVARTPHPTDRRATIVELTEVGMTAAEDTLGPRLAAVGDLFEDLSVNQRAELTKLLTKLVDGLGDRCQRA